MDNKKYFNIYYYGHTPENWYFAVGDPSFWKPPTTATTFSLPMSEQLVRLLMEWGKNSLNGFISGVLADKLEEEYGNEKCPPLPYILEWLRKKYRENK